MLIMKKEKSIIDLIFEKKTYYIFSLIDNH